MQKLRITEIFLSLQGETQTVGLPTVFVRLTGCPLRCHYCDTAYAFKGGQWMSIDAVVQQVADYGVAQVTVTGGEPLAQKACGALLQALSADFSVSLETSGAISIEHLDPRVHIVMDVKTPDSGEMDKNRLENVPLLRTTDEVKFVIGGRDDYLWSCDFLRRHDLAARSRVLFSPSYGVLDPTHLADWIIQDRLAVRLQIQLHKMLWGDEPGK